VGVADSVVLISFWYLIPYILQAGCKSLTQKAAELQSCIDNAGGVQLKKQKALVETLTGEGDSIENEITTTGVKLSSHQRQVSKLEQNSAKANQDLEEIAGETEKIEVCLDSARIAFVSADMLHCYVKSWRPCCVREIEADWGTSAAHYICNTGGLESNPSRCSRA
jgi:hypothetical protein